MQRVVRRPAAAWLLMALLGQGCVFSPPGLSGSLSSERYPDSPLVEAGVGDLSLDLEPAPDGPLLPDGFLTEALPPDASKAPDAAAICPTVCKKCTAGTCEMDCTFGCVCPPGMPCKVSCDNVACGGSIDCSQASSCTVHCSNVACGQTIKCSKSGPCEVTCSNWSCAGSITCGSGSCDVKCSDISCASDITCSGSCACSVSCDVSSCVLSNMSCPTGCSVYKGCITSPPKCNTCP